MQRAQQVEVAGHERNEPVAELVVAGSHELDEGLLLSLHGSPHAEHGVGSGGRLFSKVGIVGVDPIATEEPVRRPKMHQLPVEHAANRVLVRSKAVVLSGKRTALCWAKLAFVRQAELHVGRDLGWDFKWASAGPVCRRRMVLVGAREVGLVGGGLAPEACTRAHRGYGRVALCLVGGRCRIKGNIGRDGSRIYHVPRGQFYNRTGTATGKGERWFCTEAEARAAGWRRSKQ